MTLAPHRSIFLVRRFLSEADMEEAGEEEERKTTANAAVATTDKEGNEEARIFFEKCLALCQERGKRNPSLFIRPSAACDTSRSICTANTIYTQELLAFPPLRQLRIRINKNHFLPPPTPLCREVRFPESFHDFSPLSDLWSYPLTLLRN